MRLVARCVWYWLIDRGLCPCAVGAWLHLGRGVQERLVALSSAIGERLE